MPTCSLVHLSNHAGVVQTIGGNGANFRNVIGNSGPGKKPHAVGVKHVIVQHLFMNVNDHNNWYEMQYHDSVGPLGRHRYTIPVGQYTLAQLLAVMNTRPISAGLSLTYTEIISHGIHIGAPDSSDTDRIPGTLNIKSAAPAFRFPITLYPGGLHELLGISVDIDIATADDTLWRTPSQVNLAGPEMLFLHSRTLAPGNFIHGDGRTYNVLETIDLAGTAYGSTAKKEVDAHELNMVTYDAEEEISNVDLFLTDERMRQLTLPANARVDVVLRVLHGEDDR